jgi:hypothetical protein
MVFRLVKSKVTETECGMQEDVIKSIPGDESAFAGFVHRVGTINPYEPLEFLYGCLLLVFTLETNLGYYVFRVVLR